MNQYGASMKAVGLNGLILFETSDMSQFCERGHGSYDRVGDTREPNTRRLTTLKKFRSMRLLLGRAERVLEVYTTLLSHNIGLR